MTFKSMLMKKRWFPRPHNMQHSWLDSIDAASLYTLYPAIIHDEGLGSASAYESNLEHASFVEAAEPNCYPDSRISNFFFQLEATLTKGAITTDALPAVKFCYMPIIMAFKEDYIAIDELSSIEVQDVYDLVTESTDRQGYPGWNTTNKVEKFANSALLAANVPGLTAGQVMEGTTFVPNTFYNSLQYLTIQGKMKATNMGLRWITLTKNRPHVRIRVRLNSKVKRMNPYTTCVILVGSPAAGTHDQIPIPADTSAISHIAFTATTRYLEWHQNFNTEKA